MANQAVADRLRGFGEKGFLVQIAERRQILELKCEMPQCYHPNGRDKFESLATERRLWAPSRDHYPILRSGRWKAACRQRSAVPYRVQPA